jgi:hypothetical protein
MTAGHEDPAEAFISCSFEDRDRIQPIVQLVRAMKEGSGFQDVTDIRPGKLWYGSSPDIAGRATRATYPPRRPHARTVLRSRA